jgi:hypothetical protein
MLLVALLGLTMTVAVMGCAQQSSETTTETPATPEEPMTPAEDMPMDTTVADTTMQH